MNDSHVRRIRATMRLAIAGVLVVAGGCVDRTYVAGPTLATTPPPIPTQTSYLSVSTTTPDSGSLVIVAGNLNVDRLSTIASFTARVTYDPKSLHFVREIPLPGMLRVVNPRTSDVMIAAASANGAFAGPLFALEFRVDDPSGLASIGMTLTQLTDREFADRLPAIRQSALLLRDSTLQRGRVIPR